MDPDLQEASKADPGRTARTEGDAPTAAGKASVYQEGLTEASPVPVVNWIISSSLTSAAEWNTS
jgi:hypothetical protein